MTDSTVRSPFLDSEHPWDGDDIGQNVPSAPPTSASDAASAIALRGGTGVGTATLRRERKDAPTSERRRETFVKKKREHSWRRIATSTLIIAGIAFVLMFARLFFPIPVGLADNGDSGAITCQLGMQPVLEEGAALPWSFAVLDWTADGPATCDPFLSSTLLLVMGAEAATALTGEPGAVNLRALMLLYCLVAAVLVGILAHVVQRNLATRLVLSGALFVVLADGAFATYSGSLYGELGGILGLPIAAMGALLLHRSGRSRWLGLGLVALGGGMVVTSTLLATTTALPLVIFLIVTAVLSWRRNPATQARSSNDVVVGVGAFVLALTLGALGTGFALTVPTEQRAAAPYHVLSFRVLGNAEDPAAVVEQLDLPAGVARYVDTSVWAEPSIIGERFWPEARDSITYGQLATYFATNPLASWLAVSDGANAYHMARPDYLGTFAMGTDSEPQALESRMSVASALTSIFRNLGAIPLILVWGLLLAGSRRAVVSAPRGSLRRAAGHASVLLVGIAVVQFLTATFGDGIETTQNMVFALLATALTPVFLLAAFLEIPPTEEVVVPTPPPAEPPAEYEAFRTIDVGTTRSDSDTVSYSAWRPSDDDPLGHSRTLS